MSAPSSDHLESVRAAHHQIGNSLQSVASLLLLQARGADPRSASVLVDAGRRVRVIMRLHERLQRPSRNGLVRLDDLLRDVCRDMAELDSRDRNAVLSISLDPVLVSASDAAAIATICAELLGNALEHGLGDEDGEIALTLDAVGAGWRLSIADNGPGLSERAIATPGFGQGVVRRLARQVDARLDRRSDGRGVHYTLSHAGGPVRTSS